MTGKHRRLAPQPYYPAPPMVAPAPSVTISVLGAKNATVAKVQLHKPAKDWTGQEYLFEVADSSKREQGDVYDAKTGELLALARAFQRLSRELFSEGQRRVKVSTDAQAKARAEAYLKVHEPKEPVRRRTKEEWEEIQRQANSLTVNVPFAEKTVTYSPADAEILAGWRPDARTVRSAPTELDAPSLRAARDNLNRLLELLEGTG